MPEKDTSPLSRFFKDASYPFCIHNDPETKKHYGLELLTLSVSPELLVVHLDFIIVEERLRGQGYGTRFLTDLCVEADKYGYTIGLTPCLGFGASSVSRLKRFYHRFGFNANRGRNAELRVLNSMIRKPKLKQL